MHIVLSDNFDIEPPFQGYRILNCPLYVTMNGMSFPYDNWDEMAVTVLSWWISQAMQSQRRRRAQTEFSLCFMEGPYCLECEKNGEMVHVKCVEDMMRVVREEDVEMQVLLNELRNAAAWLIHQVEQRGWENIQDFESLKSSYQDVTEHLDRGSTS